MHIRTLNIESRSADDETRTAPAVLTTNFPVWRGTKKEVLTLDGPDSVDLSRAPLPLIESHDTSRLNIGVVENIRVVGKKLRGIVRFGSSRRATEIWQDVKAGIVRSLSIGYEWQEWHEKGDTVYVTRFMPFELSLVSAPADPQAGFFRNKDTSMNTSEISSDEHDSDDLQPVTREIKAKLSRAQRRQESALAREERERVHRIYQIFEYFTKNKPEELPIRDAFIREGTDLDTVRQYITSKTPEPIPTCASYTPEPPRMMKSTNSRILAAFSDNPRQAQESIYRAGVWMRSALLGDRAAAEWLRTYARGMTTNGAGSGGFLVPDEIAAAILVMAEEYGIARRESRIWTMGSNSLSIPNRLSGVTSFFVGEGQDATESAPTLSNFNLVSRKLMAFVPLTNELIEDAVVDIASFVVEEIARAFAEKEDRCLFLGDGTSGYGGIVGLAGAMEAGFAGYVEAASGHDTFAEVDANDLVAVMAKLPVYARRNAKWYCGKEAAHQIFTRLAMAAGGTSMAERSQYMVSSFQGYPIVETPALPATATNGQPMLYFGDLRQGVAFGDRRSITVKMDESSGLRSDEVIIAASERFDINVHGCGDATTAGPIVALVAKS